MEGLYSKSLFVYNDIEFGVDKDHHLVMMRHGPEMIRENISFQTRSSEAHFQQFFQFITEGKVPDDYNDQIEVYDILKKTNCDFSFFDSFRMRIESQIANGYIIHNNNLHKINIGSMYLHSSVFQEHIRSNSDAIFCIPEKFGENIVKIVLDIIHSRLIIDRKSVV